MVRHILHYNASNNPVCDGAIVISLAKDIL